MLAHEVHFFPDLGSLLQRRQHQDTESEPLHKLISVSSFRVTLKLSKALWEALPPDPFNHCALQCRVSMGCIVSIFIRNLEEYMSMAMIMW